jgi:uncharacterized membrane-anchored protein
MFTRRMAFWAIVIFVTSSATVLAAPKGLESTAEEFTAKLSFRQGKVTLPNGLATLNLFSDFRYLDAEQARRVLVKAWGNPPESAQKVLGMLFPTTLDPLDAESWGVVITYEEDGYVSDEGAEKINYDTLLKEMQAGAREGSKARQKQGYEPVELIGWAEPPHYDRLTYKLYWAKELKFGNDTSHTLNYNIRVLGRHGVLVLNAVAGIEQLPAIRSALTRVLPMVEFNEGYRYTDYIPGKDKVAEYGVAALVAGSAAAAAAKAGLFKGLVAVFLASKKAVIIGLVALGVLIKSLFRRK